MSEHYVMGTHPATGKPWAFCLACSSGNAATIEALQAACQQSCQRLFYDKYGHTMTAAERRLMYEEATEHLRTEAENLPSSVLDEYGNPLNERI